MAAETNKQFYVPAALNHWTSDALRTNQHLLECLNAYPGPTGVSRNLVPTVRYKLKELRTLNEQIAKMSAGWLDCGEE